MMVAMKTDSSYFPPSYCTFRQCQSLGDSPSSNELFQGTMSSQEAKENSQSDCIAKLTSLLEHTLSESNAIKGHLPGSHYSDLLSDPPLYLFSTSLLNALLAESSTVFSSLDRLLSFISQHRDMIACSLEMVSLRCLAKYLLNPGTEAGPESGLCLLVDEPEYVADLGSTRPQLDALKSGDMLQLVQDSLIQRAYTIFVDETVEPRIRRMAGKVLVDMVYGSEKHCQLLRDLTHDDDCLKPIIHTLNDPDGVLSFFANAFIRVLYHSSANSWPGWELDGPHSRLLSHIRSQGNPAEQFHSYVCAERQHIYSVRGVNGLDGARDAVPTCYLLESDETLANRLPQGPVLLSFTTGRLNLIHSGNEATGYNFDYMALRPIDRTRTRCIFSNCHEQKPLLFLHINAGDSLTVNDQRRSSPIVTLSITSKDDLEKIQKGLEAIGIRCETQRTRTYPSGRMSSSLVIPLDTADEVARRSSPTPEAPSRRVIERPTNSVRWRDESSKLREHFDHVSETGIENASQSSLTELTRTPTIHGASSPGAWDSFLPAIPETSAENQTDKEILDIPNIPIEDLRNGEIMGSCLNDTQGTQETIHTEEQTFQDGAVRNTRSSSSQNTNSVSMGAKLRPIPPNTQESLIFPRRRPRGKIYTAPTKTVVDWDEGLRESDSPAGKKSLKDAELTSISSPLSNGPDCVFNMGSKVRDKVSIRRKPGLKAIKQRKKARKGKGGRRSNRKAKLLSPPQESLENGFCQNDPHMDVPGEIREQKTEGNKLEGCNSSPLVNPTNLNKPSHASRDDGNASDQTPNTFQLQERDSSNGQAGLKTSFEGRNIAKGSLHEVEGDQTGEKRTLSHSTDDKSLGERHEGRGQTFAHKLIAALRAINTPEDCCDERREEADQGIETITEPTKARNVPVDESLYTDYEPHEADDLRNMSEASTLDMEEPYLAPLRDESQNGSSKDNVCDSQSLKFAKRVSLFKTEGNQERSRIWKTSSVVASSSIKPMSTESTFDSCHTNSEPQPNDPTSPELSEDVLSSGMVKMFSGFTGGASYEISDMDGNGDKRQPTGRPREISAEQDVNCVINFPEPNPKTTVDKNGSPRRLMNEHVIPKKRLSCLFAEQTPSAKRRNTSNQDDDGDFKKDEIQNNDPQVEYCYTTTGSVDTDDNPNEDGRPSFERTIEEPKRADGASDIGKEMNHKIGRLLKVSRSTPSGSSLKTQEPLLTREKRDHGITFKASAGKLPLQEGADSELKVACELSKGTANQTNQTNQTEWQTSLQELRQGVQSTLLSASEQLSRQIESERTTVKNVLGAYREQCHTVLDQLFEAQMERIRLCKRQMDSIKQQHADVCQELICRLEGNEQGLRATSAYGSQ
ncbi:hypothetical protein BDW59DRAFT_15114 [Aspergillus cavernicola]|uniref:Uncharacterized protein n=1 Tax=Aspergillus cavernicola TaxID=176166 RepID=A0ABR4HJI8_9EURO